jgi:elongation factor P
MVPTSWTRPLSTPLRSHPTSFAILQVDKYNGNPISLRLPAQVELAVTYTEPATRGDTASGSVTKAAKLETGLEIRVPFFIKEGEKIRVSTETREFAGRA